MEKHEEIVFNKRRVRKRADAKSVKWLGIIVDENLMFDLHWKERIEKARKF